MFTTILGFTSTPIYLMTHIQNQISYRHLSWKIMFDTSTFWPLTLKGLTWCQILEPSPDILFHCASFALKLSVLVWVPGQLKRNPVRLTKTGEHFAPNDFIRPWKCWPKVTNFSPERVLIHASATSQSFVFPALLRAEITVEGIICPPSSLPERVALRLRPSPLRAFNHATHVNR